MEGKSRDHDVCTVLQLRIAIGCSGNATAGGLQDEREEIAGHEDDGVRLWSEAGDVGGRGRVEVDDAGEAEVD